MCGFYICLSVVRQTGGVFGVDCPGVVFEQDGVVGEVGVLYGSG